MARTDRAARVAVDMDEVLVDIVPGLLRAYNAAFGERLLFPAEFVGRGDMSRGGLLLRRVREARELDYVPVQGAVRHGKRPPKLERLR